MTEDRADKVLELVVFKLREGTKHEDFLTTVGPVSDWAMSQPGFISRDLSYDAEGDRWIDLIWWRTLEEPTPPPRWRSARHRVRRCSRSSTTSRC
jgi:hypothetical protein